MNDITVVIPTSPLPSHPSTRIIDETIESVRYHLPKSDIILTFDGVHPKQRKMADAYEKYKMEMYWRCLHKYTNILPISFKNYTHQSGMMHEAMKHIKTDLVLYVEGDAPLTKDEIDWVKCIYLLLNGDAYTIRYHFENVIPQDHKSLMIGKPENGFQRTIQWSQRPHLSTKVYYEDLLKQFPKDAKTFIEDVWHGVVMEDFNINGMLGWYKHRLWIYYPEDGIKRSYTTDGREGGPKFGEGFKQK